jgi:glutamyl-tRNA synthetase
MLAFLGWNPGTEQELFNLDELIAAFDISKVGKSGAKFDAEKTKWFQHQYFIQKEDSAIAQLFAPVLEQHLGNSFDKDLDLGYITKVVGLIKERATFTEDLWDLGSFFFMAPEAYDEKAAKKNWKEGTADLMLEISTIIENITDFSSQNIENEIKEWITSKEIGFGKVMQPLRLSLVGALKGPHLSDIAFLIGRDETVKRIRSAVEKLG